MTKAFSPDQNALPGYAKLYGDITEQLIKEKSVSLVGQASRSIDIVQNVLNLVPVHWIAHHVVRKFRLSMTDPCSRLPSGWYSNENGIQSARATHRAGSVPDARTDVLVRYPFYLTQHIDRVQPQVYFHQHPAREWMVPEDKCTEGVDGHTDVHSGPP